jgi:hypothetical protein
MLILSAVCTAAALFVPYLLPVSAQVFAAASLAFAGMMAAFAAVWRLRPGPPAVAGAILILVDIVLALRAVLTPR